VSEGAGARSLREELDEDSTALNRALDIMPQAIQNASLAVYSNQAPPAHLEDLVGRIAPRPLLLMYERRVVGFFDAALLR
jgi:hypothetical protein